MLLNYKWICHFQQVLFYNINYIWKEKDIVNFEKYFYKGGEKTFN
jgi:hypothetical protein|tara:strand:+ start:1083 stop:1217 length:135 start_codon:yes stop_codon:yes gene_type:complete